MKSFRSTVVLIFVFSCNVTLVLSQKYELGLRFNAQVMLNAVNQNLENTKLETTIFNDVNMANNQGISLFFNKFYSKSISLGVYSNYTNLNISQVANDYTKFLYGLMNLKQLSFTISPKFSTKYIYLRPGIGLNLLKLKPNLEYNRNDVFETQYLNDSKVFTTTPNLMYSIALGTSIKCTNFLAINYEMELAKNLTNTIAKNKWDFSYSVFNIHLGLSYLF